MSATYNALASAIATEENSTWPNNPGAITGSNGTPLTFDSFADGYQALIDKLTLDASGQSTVYSPNMTLEKFENLYTNGDPNAANNLSNILGVPTTTTLVNLSDQNLDAPYSLPDTNTIPELSTDLPNPVMGSTSISNTGQITNAGTPDNGAAVTTTSAANSGGILSGFETWLTSSSANIVAVVLGLILVAAAVFSFSAVKDTAIKVGKKIVETGV